MKLSVEERLELWHLACQKRRQLLKRNRKETPRSERLLKIILKLGNDGQESTT